MDNWCHFSANFGWSVPSDERQVRKIVSKVVIYYNAQRINQGIGKEIPDVEITESSGNIKKLPVLSGLHHHYYR